MKVLWDIYKGSWTRLRGSKKIWIILFIVNFIAALFLALPFQSYLSRVAGYSAMLSEHIGSFDFTFLGDFMNQYGDGVWVLLNQAKYLVLLFLAISIFLNGGLIAHIVRKRPLEQFSFFHNCGLYFWRLLRMALSFIVLYGCIVFICWSLFKWLMGGLSPFTWDSDGQLINAYYIVVFLMSFLLFMSLMIHDYAKIIMVQKSDPQVWNSIKGGFLLVRQNFLSCSLLYLVHFISFVLLFLLYRYLRCTLSISGLISVLVLFVLSQVFVLFRIGIKILNLSSAHLFVSSKL